jgi:hypothetical protein
MTGTDDTTKDFEVWMPLPDWEGIYEASSLGRVRRDPWAFRGKVGVVLGVRLKKGYPVVQLTSRGRKRTAQIHVLIAATFLGPRPPGLVINHRDADKLNSRPENLEYCTQAQNIHHAMTLGRTARGLRNGANSKPERRPRGPRHGAYTKPEKLARGESHGNAKLTESIIREIRARVAAGEAANRVAREIGINPSTAQRIVRGIAWGHVA